jgi:hypothetical protein
MKNISLAIGIAANLLSIFLLLALLQVIPTGNMPLLMFSSLIFLLALTGLVLAIIGRDHKGVRFALAITLNALGLLWPFSLFVIGMIVYFN